ncbi:T9SS type A sorting domain-containing protein [Fulvivirga sp. M361]|uniref:T9SS type A sorting domain-containing protein n=1 Tax=Fulvivirga sp. M361 TaxID=2594266 RepID=UPI00117B3CD0|nr:T9SS type A sorting domain-containing protein [Fulvivirga sp. M361]TRX58821.1 T9SS type A sorting domain-containing protein [Fulvivirga sp. M361]
MKKNCLLSLVLLLFGIASCFGQTPGLIVDPASVAGAAVMDPNGDGYVSTGNGGFSVNDNSESEIPFQPLTVPSVEPGNDVATGPGCGFTDFADDGTKYSSAFFLDGADNWLFRFRLGGFGPNSKGYSVLIDTDNRFGSSGSQADPNYVVGNPGFEIEIQLVTNFGVRLYDVDGSTSPTLQTTLAYDDYAQKSVAFSTTCSDPDYFYDFYIPFATITTFFPSISTSTAIRAASNTVISTQSGITGGVSDVGGVDNNAFGGNLENIWEEIILGQVPTSPIDINGGFPPIRSETPAITGPVNGGDTSVSGTSVEADGTIIEVFVNNMSVGTTTVSGGGWTLSGLPALVVNDVLTATATVISESESLNADEVIVGSVCSTQPTIICFSRKGIEGYVVDALSGTTINIYNNGGLVTSLTTTIDYDAGNPANPTFLYNCSASGGCSAGGLQCLAGSYWITAVETGKCESTPQFADDGSSDICLNGGGSGVSGTEATPVISTNPIETSTSSIAGTATTDATIYLYIDGFQQSTTTATSGNWTFSTLSLSLGSLIEVRAFSSGSCISGAASRSVTEQSGTPSVTSPIPNGSTSVSGTSSEDSGTIIEVFVDGASQNTGTVDANGNWTITVPTLNTGEVVTATATTTGKSTSLLSSPVTVLANSTAPVISGSYSEGGTSVTGTSASADGTVITTYIDGISLGTTSVSGGNWTLSGLSAANFDLYAGGTLAATATEAGNTESAVSNTVTVSCTAPLTDRTVNVLTNEICASTSAQVQLTNSETSVIYTLRDNSNTTDRSSSLLGTGGSITFNSFTLTGSETLQIEAKKIPDTSCSGLNANTAAITVYPNPFNDRGITSTNDNLGSGGSTTIEVANSEVNVSYQLRNDADDSTIGSAVVGTGGTILLPTGSLTSTTTFNVLGTDTDPITCSIEQLQTVTVSIAPLPVELVSFEAKVASDKNSVELKWVTATELFNDFFTLERSMDASNFQALEVVQGAGNSSQLLNYTYTDQFPVHGVSYYRLKQTDFDGAFEYSKTIAVSYENIMVQMTVHPNPFSSFTTFRLNSAIETDERLQVLLFDALGNEVRHLEGTREIILYRSDLPQGMYWYKVFVNARMLEAGKLLISDN